MLKERNTRDHRWYQKVQHAKLAKRDYDRTWIYPSGLRRIDEAFMKHQGYAVSGYVPKTLADFKNGVYVVDGIQTTFSAAFQHTATSNATMTGGYGEEEVSEQFFESNWTVSSGWAVEDGVATCTANNTSLIYTDGTNDIVDGGVYEVRFRITAYTSGTLYISCGAEYSSTLRGQANTIGEHVILVTAGSNDAKFVEFYGGVFRGSITDISVREAPKVQWRPHNLVTHSEDFSGSDWVIGNISVTTNATRAPHEDLQSADELTPTATSNAHSAYQVISGVDGTQVQAVWVKPNGYTKVALRENDAGTFYSAFELAGSGTVLFNSGTTGIISEDNGWYKLQIEGAKAGNTRFGLYILDPAYTTGSVTGVWTADGTSGVYAWGAHLYRSDLGGMADVPATERVLPALTKYVRTAGRVIGEDLVTNGDFSAHADELVTDGTFDARGDELVANGGFTLGSVDWVEGTNATIANGKLTYAGGSGNTDSYQSLGGGTVPSGAVLEFKFTVSGRTQGAIGMRIGGGLTSTANADGNYTLYATSPASGIIYIDPSSNFVGSIDNISVREVLADWSVVGNTPVLYLSNDALVVENGDAALGYVSQGFATESGKTYELNFDFIHTGSDDGFVRVGTTQSAGDLYDTSFGDLAASKSKSVTFTATGTTSYVRLGNYNNTLGLTTSFDNISVKEAVPGWTLSGNGPVEGSVNDSNQLEWDRNGGTSGIAAQDITTVAGNFYKVTYDVVAISYSLRPVWDGANQTEVSATGSYEFTVAATDASSTLRFSLTQNSAATATIDNVKVEEVDVDPSSARYMARIGHHVFNGQQWVNEGLELESEARTNLVTYSEDFTSWSSASNASVGSGVTGPDGVSGSLQKIVEDATTSNHYFTQLLTVPIGTNTFSCFAKDAGDGRWLYLRTNYDGANQWIVVDLSDGSVTDVGTAVLGYGTIDCGNGIYRAWFSCNSSDGSSGMIVGPSNTATTGATIPNYTGDGTSGVYAGFVQVEAGPTPSSYTPTSGSSVTRAAETLVQTGDKAPWPTAVYATNDELVTNGTFDTDTSGWADASSAGGSIAWNASGYMDLDAATATSRANQDISVTAGAVYVISVTVIDLGGSTSCGLYLDGAATVSINFASLGVGTHTIYYVAPDSSMQFSLRNFSTGTVVTIDNISVKEINPRALSAVMDGRVTYADEGGFNTAGFVRMFGNSDNDLKVVLDTNSTETGEVNWRMEANAVQDNVSTATDAYSPGINVPVKVAGRFLDNAVQGAADGTATTENTTPVGLPDLETTDLAVGYDFMGTIRTFRMFDQDIASTGLVSSTEPSLEPTLSLVFDGSGDSYIDFDWSE